MQGNWYIAVLSDLLRSHRIEALDPRLNPWWPNHTAHALSKRSERVFPKTKVQVFHLQVVRGIKQIKGFQSVWVSSIRIHSLIILESLTTSDLFYRFSAGAQNWQIQFLLSHSLQSRGKDNHTNAHNMQFKQSFPRDVLKLMGLHSKEANWALIYPL